jgi:pilT-like protein
MATLSKASVYTVAPTDSFFFDTNIWMLLFAPIANVNYHRQNVYGTLLRNIQNSNAKIKINSLVVSEFINAYLKLSFKLWQDASGNYSTEYKKDFKGTEEYLEAVEEAKDNIKAILGITQKIADGFISVNLDKIISDIIDRDFNDAYYIEMCKINKLKLVTDDSDLLSSTDDIEIITERKLYKH